MQARFGSHGDYALISLCPNSPQECFDLTVEAFNLSEQYRVPVLVMMDECVGHMTERVVIPPADQIKIFPRRYTARPPGEYLPFKPNRDLVPDMTKAGDGYRIHVTGLTHDERGYPDMTPECQAILVRRLVDKVRKNADSIVRFEERNTEKAETVVISYGITSRVAERAVQMAREKGAKVGSLRLITAWPFPEKRVSELSRKVKAFVVPELNFGQMALEVERIAGGRCATRLIPHAGGTVHDPQVICDAILEVMR
jgi:2-oxoglutarate ferredoxin oxidoreductase subunit alpha